MSAAPDALPRALGEPVLRARFRATPEDFFVEELPGFEPSGSGEHLLLTIEKRGMNTAHAARRIAQWAGVGEVAIGVAGMKDRHAVTRQRVSVHLPRKVAPDLAALPFDEAGESLRVLEHAWHAKKLPRGALAGNRFVLVLRDVEGERDAIEARLRLIAERGLPNYFGEQRFGRGGDNVAAALAMFSGRRVRREQASLLLSAARSELFNRVLAARVERGCWDSPLDGEVWMLDGSRSVFGPQPFDDTLRQRLGAFDIHPTGPLWGRGEPRVTDAVAAL
ncbi:MAG TPA: tRNA pseudouridine(13) synthase TruD, partial [Lysobacter sp.]